MGYTLVELSLVVSMVSRARGRTTGERSRAFGVMLVGLIRTRFLLYVPPLGPMTW